MAKAAGENFPVALRLLPATPRRYLAAVYRFARTTDDIGDEGPAADRPRLLDELEADLRRLYGAAAADEPPGQVRPDLTTLPAVAGLGPAVAECGIPMRPFLDLIAANRQDQAVSRYQTFEDLVGYCRLSANPVGRIVLHVFGCYSDSRAMLSDAVCTALQLAEHWQDVAEDLRAGRVYLPQQDLRDHGCTERDLAAPAAPAAVRALLHFETDRARALLDSGAPLVGDLRGAARAAVAGYVAGGRATLAAIAAARYDVLASTPRPRRSGIAGRLALTYVRGR